MPLGHRLQILLDDDQYTRLSQRAEAEGRSVGSLVREAIDFMWTGPNLRKATILQAILTAEPMPVPEPQDLVRELDALRGARFGPA